MKKFIFYIIVAWSLLAFVGYNVLSAEASKSTEKNDKKVCESYGGEWKKSVYNKSCNFNNDKDEELYSLRPGYSLDGTSADAEYGRLDLDIDDETAAEMEDDICAGEDADYTNVNGCMSEKREKLEKELKKACYDADDGKWTASGCNIKGDEDEPAHEDEPTPEVVIEDWSNEVEQPDYEEKNIQVEEEDEEEEQDESEEQEEEDNSYSES